MERLLNFLLIRIKVPPSIPPETVLIPKSEIVIAERSEERRVGK